MTAVHTKRQMYQMLAAGEFGNSVPQWLNCLPVTGPWV